MVSSSKTLSFCSCTSFTTTKHSTRRTDECHLAKLYLSCSTNQQMFIFCCKGSFAEGRDRGCEHLCVCVCHSLVDMNGDGRKDIVAFTLAMPQNGQTSLDVCPPFRRALYFSSSEYFFDCKACLVLDLRSGNISRFSLISFHSQRFGCTMSRKLK
jgi:hypothetical protein